jgi:hypothetical protein
MPGTCFGAGPVDAPTVLKRPRYNPTPSAWEPASYEFATAAERVRVTAFVPAPPGSPSAGYRSARSSAEPP